MADNAFTEAVFWLFAAISVAGALGVVRTQNMFRAALMLVVSFLGVAGIFVLVNAAFLAVIQVLVYAGGVSVLVIFAVMLTKDVAEGNRSTRVAPVALLAALSLLAVLIVVVTGAEWQLLPADLAGSPIEAVFVRHAGPARARIAERLRARVRGRRHRSARRGDRRVGAGEGTLSMFERLLILSAVLFCIGLYGALSRRHLIAVLISIEIMFNAVNVALVAASRYATPAELRGVGAEAVSRCHVRPELGRGAARGAELRGRSSS